MISFLQIWIYGSSYESFLVAVANPNKESLQSWAQDSGVIGDFNSICENPKANAYILGELTNIGKQNKVSFSLRLEGLIITLKFIALCLARKRLQ